MRLRHKPTGQPEYCKIPMDSCLLLKRTSSHHILVGFSVHLIKGFWNSFGRMKAVGSRLSLGLTQPVNTLWGTLAAPTWHAPFAQYLQHYCNYRPKDSWHLRASLMLHASFVIQAVVGRFLPALTNNRLSPNVGLPRYQGKARVALVRAPHHVAYDPSIKGIKQPSPVSKCAR